MKSTVFTIFKKELKRFFSDKRMAVTTILLPGLMIFVMYNFMGSAISNIANVDENQSVYISAVNIPESMEAVFSQWGIETDIISENDIQTAKDAVSAGGDISALVIFPENFEKSAAEYDVSEGGKAPNIEIYYNSADTASLTVYSMLTEIFDSYESSMANKFDINNSDTDYDLSSDRDITATVFSTLLPLLMLVFLYSGCMAVGIESIAGEKERGTIATLLVTPAKRSHIAVGKIGALAIIALLSGASSAIGTLSSLPKLMAGAAQEIRGSFYTASDYILLALVILSTVLVLITIISIVSAFAKTVKEAQSYVLPVMIIVMLAGITGMFGEAKTEIFYYMIPIYNSVQSMVGIFSFNISYAHIAVTVGANIIAAGIGVFILTRLFGSERVMFSK